MIKEVENWLNTVRSQGTKKSYRTNIESFFEYRNYLWKSRQVKVFKH